MEREGLRREGGCGYEEVKGGPGELEVRMGREVGGGGYVAVPF